MSPFDTTHFLTPSPHQNRRRRARVEKVGLETRIALRSIQATSWFAYAQKLHDLGLMLYGEADLIESDCLAHAGDGAREFNCIPQ